MHFVLDTIFNFLITQPMPSTWNKNFISKLVYKNIISYIIFLITNNCIKIGKLSQYIKLQ